VASAASLERTETPWRTNFFAANGYFFKTVSSPARGLRDFVEVVMVAPVSGRKTVAVVEFASTRSETFPRCPSWRTKAFCAE